MPAFVITTPPYEWPTRTTGPVVRWARNDATYAASPATPCNRFGGVSTVKPWACSSVDTAFQLEPSAQAPWTRTIVGFGMASSIARRPTGCSTPTLYRRQEWPAPLRATSRSASTRDPTRTNVRWALAGSEAAARNVRA